MDPVRWTEKSLEFRSLVDSQHIKKPVLALYGDRSAIVGVKICGEFITACPSKITKNQIIPEKEEIVLSSKFQGTWKVISKGTSKNEYHIRRLSTMEIEEIHMNDIEKQRMTPRTFICTKETEAFDLLIHQNDPNVYKGCRIDRRKKRLEENVEFEIVDIGEVEYTPSEAERTSQDYVSPNKKSLMFLPFRMSVNGNTELVVRNRVVRALSCKTRSESQRRHFLLEINDDPCDIRPVASEGSVELRYVHSTQNLYNYMSHYGNDIFLCVRLVRGEMPVKATDFDGNMIFTSTFVGDRVPMCYIHNHVLSLVSPDVPVRVKLPLDESKWRSLPEIHTAERQCMGLSLALLSRYESESYVIVDKSPNAMFNVRSKDDQKIHTLPPRKRSGPIEKTADRSEKAIQSPQLTLPSSQHTHRMPLRATKTAVEYDEASLDSSTFPGPKMLLSTHPPSDLLYRDYEKQVTQDGSGHDRRPPRSEEKSAQSQSKNSQNLSTSQSSVVAPQSILKNKNRQ